MTIQRVRAGFDAKFSVLPKVDSLTRPYRFYSRGAKRLSLKGGIRKVFVPGFYEIGFSYLLTQPCDRFSNPFFYIGTFCQQGILANHIQSLSNLTIFITQSQ